METPFRHHVPANYKENLEWRAGIHRKVHEDISSIQSLRDACAADPIFWISGFCWTYDPRRKPYPKLPFILYPFQVDAIGRLIDAIGDYDILIEKSRDMGASWICTSALMWYWMFKPMQSLLFVSRNEKYVDAPGNPKALFYKVDFILDSMPEWLRPLGYNANSHRRMLHIENPENGSVIDGESTTGDVARGDRRTAILLDEFAAVQEGSAVLRSTRDATNSRIFNSTPKGTANAFYRQRCKKELRKIRLHWSVHPRKAIGLYTTSKDGELGVLDRDNFPDGYLPILDGKLRSPWYDNECERAASSQEIAQELDINYLGSDYQFFNEDRTNEYISKFSRSPLYVGDLEYDSALAEPIRFTENPKGCMSLWCTVDGDWNVINQHQLVIGIDISAGTGASNSCLACYDMVTREKLLGVDTPYVRPEEFARLAVAVAKWIKGQSIFMPRLIWENNGPGRQFGSRVVELGYTSIYNRIDDSEFKGKKIADIPGWASTKESKLVLLGNYRNAIEKEEIINPSRASLDETLEYIFLPNGSIAHAGEKDKEDPSGASSNHGDRVMADALAWKLMGAKKKITEKEKPDEPVGSLAWRMKQRLGDTKKGTRLLRREWYRR